MGDDVLGVYCDVLGVPAIQLVACLHEPGWLALQRSRHLSLTQQKSTLRLYDNRASPVWWDTSIVMPGSRVEIYRVITLAGRPGE